VFLSSTSSRGPKTNKLPADNYHSAEITKASVHVEAYKRLFPNLALMLSGHNKLMTFKNLNLAVGVSFAARINKNFFVYPSCKRYYTTKTTDTQSGCVYIYDSIREIIVKNNPLHHDYYKIYL